MRRIMSGEMSPVMIAACHRPAREEGNHRRDRRRRAGDARVRHPVAVADRTHLVDIVGTGGDGSHTFNISTCACSWPPRPARAWPSTATAACQHQRQADVLEALGANINLTPRQVAPAWPTPASASCSRPTTTRR
jgi:anthranilate phosphoribosyltransferase